LWHAEGGAVEESEALGDETRQIESVVAGGRLNQWSGSLPVHPSTSKMLLFGNWCFNTIFSKLKLKIQMIC
jgi:hypothetical protein